MTISICFFYMPCNSSSCILLNRKLSSNLVNPLNFTLFPWNKFFPLNNSVHKPSFDSSVGRAEDCSSVVDILRSLARIRLKGIFYFVNNTDSSYATYCKLFLNSFCIDNYFNLFFWYSLQVVFFSSFEQKTIPEFSKSPQVHAFSMK